MFVYEILPRYFAHRTLKKLKKEYAGDIDGFFMANDNKDQEDYLKKTIDLARKYIQDIYEHDKPNVDITKEKIAYILSNDAQNETNTITTIEIISPVVHFLNDIDTYVEGKTEVLKQMILQEGKEKKLTPLEIIEQLEKRDNHNTI